jgi:hypothetical protein
MKRNLCLFVLCFLVIARGLLYSQESNSKYITNPEKYIADEIFNNKITLVGDGIHNSPIYISHITNILNNWYEAVLENEDLNANLTLVLEHDSQSVALMDNYVKTGNIRPLFDFITPGFYLENLEQWYEYRKLYKCIEEANKSRKKKISFCLKGFEVVGIDTNEYYNLSKEETESYFINERDKYTSNGLIRYANNNPEQRILIFYGNSHLIPGLYSKWMEGFSTPKEKCESTWLVQYLIDEFGKDSVNIIYSVMLDSNLFAGAPFENLLGKLFLMNGTYEEIYYLNVPGIKQYLIIPHTEIPIHDINFALSKYIIEKSIERVGVFEKYHGYKATSGTKSIKYLNFLFGKKFENSNDIKNWYDTTYFAGFNLMDTKELYDNIHSQYLSMSSNRSAYSLLIDLGFPPSNLRNIQIDENFWRENIWKEAIKEIKFINAIEIFWVGYPDEQEAAKKYLIEFSGKNYNEPAQFLKWWRTEYHNYGI